MDRIILNSNLGNRLADSVETAVNLSDGILIVEYENETLPKKYRKKETIIFSSKFSCPESGFTIEEIEPRLFSFNSPYGACEECEGIGHNLNVDPNLVISDPKKSLQDGAIEPWSKSTSLYYAQTVASLAKHYKISLADPWKKIPKKIQDIILYGSDDEEIKFSYDDGYEVYTTKKLLKVLLIIWKDDILKQTVSGKEKKFQYQSETNCEKCKGMRLKDEALCIKINSLNISQVTDKSIDEAQKWFSNLDNFLNEKENKIAQHILKEINERLNFLLNVGLNYLTFQEVWNLIRRGSTKDKVSVSNRFGFNWSIICFR